MKRKMYLGIDIGSTTLKAVVINSRGKVQHTLYQRTKPIESRNLSCRGKCNKCGRCNLGTIWKTIDNFLSQAAVNWKDIYCCAVTGSQIVEDLHKFIPYDYQVSEVTAHAAGARHYYPDCKAILDVGGQDSKAMVYNENMGMWMSKMSGICAAGTGAFLDSVAAKLDIPVEKMADMVNYDTELEFSSVCAVLGATSINKFKNRYPIGDLIGGACRAQARMVMSGVGELLLNYKGEILFQGGVASNRAVAYFLREITKNPIIIPEFHKVMGALGAACIAKEYAAKKNYLRTDFIHFEDRKSFSSIAMRTKETRKQFLAKSSAPMVWRNLFFPTEILNALGVRILTMETYAALFARNNKRIKAALDNAASRGFSAETCTFLRILEGINLPKPDFAVSTSEPCQQGERIFADLSRNYGIEDKFYSLYTPISISSSNAVENIASGLEECIFYLEKALGKKLDKGKLAEACFYSNQAREWAAKCNELRYTSPPLIRGTYAVYFAAIFSQLWGKKELIDLHRQFYEELAQNKERIEKELSLEDTHRILWLHLPPFYDTKILDFIETGCNAPIVFEEVNFVEWTPLNPDDPYRSLAKKLLTVGFLDPKLRVKHICDYSKMAKFNGCILYNHGFGRCSLSDSCFIKHLREELNKSNMPLLVLDGDCMDPTTDPCSTFTKIKAYVEALNESKYGNIFGPIRKKVVSEVFLPKTASRKTIPFSMPETNEGG